MTDGKRVFYFRADQPPTAVLERFAGSQAEVQALWRESAEFREICRDYREARASMSRTRGRKGDEAAGEAHLAELVAELEQEMVSLLDLSLRNAE